MRWFPSRPLPDYTYVPGHAAHPLRDPQGHSFGQEFTETVVPGEENWRTCHSYLWGLDLFNAGYYWEAHESWEATWICCGRSGLVADGIKGLIKLAAAGVKLREGRPSGTVRHAQRAHELFGVLQEAGRAEFLGLATAQLLERAAELSRNAESIPATSEIAPVAPLWSWQLIPQPSNERPS